MAETACPFCAFSPIKRGAERCPRCNRKFVDDVREDSVVTATRLGGITGAVTASPVPVAVALVIGAVAWFLRVLDVFASLKDPVLLLVVPALLVAGAASVMAAAGPAKHAPALLGLMVMCATALWWTPIQEHNLAFLIFGALILVSTVSEPSPIRLKAGTALAAIVALAGLGALALGPKKGAPVGASSIVDERVGLRWELPAGWKQVDRLDVLLPPTASARRAVMLASNGDSSSAMLMLDRAGGAGVCDEVLVPFPDLVKSNDEPGGPFPRGTRALEGGQFMAACAALPNGPVLAIVVHTTGPAMVLPATLRVLSTQALVLADPAGP